LSSALLTQWRSCVLVNLIVAQQVKKFTAIHGTVRYINMFTRVFRWTLSTFYRITLKDFLYYAYDYLILCDPSTAEWELNHWLAVSVNVLFRSTYLIYIKSECEYEAKIWRESFVVWVDGRWNVLSTVAGCVSHRSTQGISVKNRSVTRTFRFNLLRKVCLGVRSVATRFPFISGVLGRHNLRMGDSEDAHGIVRRYVVPRNCTAATRLWTVFV
jgi:hypothetical protein